MGQVGRIGCSAGLQARCGASRTAVLRECGPSGPPHELPGQTVCTTDGVITRRPCRLPSVSYVGVQRYFLTICTAFRRPVFVTDATVDACLMELRATAVLFDFGISAYCFMPDHLHALLTATSDQADFKAFVKRFKQMSGFNFHRRHAGRLWQPGYYEHILRDDEATEAVARYILENPLRGGLGKQFGDYPYGGSDTHELSALADLWADLKVRTTHLT